MLRKREGTIPLPDDWGDAATLVAESYIGYDDLSPVDQGIFSDWTQSSLNSLKTQGIAPLDFDTAKPVIDTAEEFLDRKFDEWDISFASDIVPMGMGFKRGGEWGGFAYPGSRVYGLRAHMRSNAYDLLEYDPLQPLLVAHELTHVYEGLKVERVEQEKALKITRRGMRSLQPTGMYSHDLFRELPSCLVDASYAMDDPQNTSRLQKRISHLLVKPFGLESDVLDELQSIAIEIEPEVSCNMVNGHLVYPSALYELSLHNEQILNTYDRLRGSFWMIGQELYGPDYLDPFTCDVMRAHVYAEPEELFARFNERMGEGALPFLDGLAIESNLDMALLNMYARAGEHADADRLRNRLHQVKEALI